MRVRIDEARCTGHGRCYATAPDVFDCDDRGYGVAPAEPIGDDLVAQARLAEQNCPESAVILENEKDENGILIGETPVVGSKQPDGGGITHGR